MQRLYELLTNINFWTAVGAVGAFLAAIIPVWIHFRSSTHEKRRHSTVTAETRIQFLESAREKLRQIEAFDMASFVKDDTDGVMTPDKFMSYLTFALEPFTKERNVFREVRPYLDKNIAENITKSLNEFDSASALSVNTSNPEVNDSNARTMLKTQGRIAIEFRRQLTEALEKQLERLVA